MNSYSASSSATSCLACPAHSSTQSLSARTARSACACEPGYDVTGDAASFECVHEEGPPLIICGTGAYLAGEMCVACPARTYGPDGSHCLACPVAASSPEASSTRLDCACDTGFVSSLALNTPGVTDENFQCVAVVMEEPPVLPPGSITFTVSVTLPPDSALVIDEAYFARLALLLAASMGISVDRVRIYKTPTGSLDISVLSGDGLASSQAYENLQDTFGGSGGAALLEMGLDPARVARTVPAGCAPVALSLKAVAELGLSLPAMVIIGLAGAYVLAAIGVHYASEKRSHTLVQRLGADYAYSAFFSDFPTFLGRVRDNVTKNHLLLSSFFGDLSSAFTGLQRLSTLFSSLALLLLVTGVFYTNTPEPGTGTVGTGIAASLIVAPYALLVSALFSRRERHREVCRCIGAVAFVLVVAVGAVVGTLLVSTQFQHPVNVCAFKDSSIPRRWALSLLCGFLFQAIVSEPLLIAVCTALWPRCCSHGKRPRSARVRVHVGPKAESDAPTPKSGRAYLVTADSTEPDAAKLLQERDSSSTNSATSSGDTAEVSEKTVHVHLALHVHLHGEEQVPEVRTEPVQS